MKQLRNDVQLLRDEVRRLSELIEQKDNPPRAFVPQPDETMPLETFQLPDLRNSNQVLYFTGNWCRPCQRLIPLIARLKKQGLPIRVVDVDRDRELTQQYNVESIPCFILVSKGEEVKRIKGEQTEEILKKLLQDVSTDRSEK